MKDTTLPAPDVQTKEPSSGLLVDVSLPKKHKGMSPLTLGNLMVGILKNAKRELDLSKENLETLVDFEDLVDTTFDGAELSGEDVLPEMLKLGKRDVGDVNFALGDGLPELPTIGAGGRDTSVTAAGSFLAPVALLVLLRNLIPGGAGRIHPRQFR